MHLLREQTKANLRLASCRSAVSRLGPRNDRQGDQSLELDLCAPGPLLCLSACSLESAPAAGDASWGESSSPLNTLGRRSNPIITVVIIRGTSLASFNKNFTSCGPLTCAAVEGGVRGAGYPSCREPVPASLLPGTPDSPAEAQRCHGYHLGPLQLGAECCWQKD